MTRQPCPRCGGTKWIADYGMGGVTHHRVDHCAECDYPGPVPADQDVETVRAMIFCPEHRMRDCSPLLNGCSRVNQAHDALDRLAAAVPADREARQALEAISAVRLDEELPEEDSCHKARREMQSLARRALAAAPPAAGEPDREAQLREWAEAGKQTADEQMSQMPDQREFWRGRRGAFIDMLAALADPETA